MKSNMIYNWYSSVGTPAGIEWVCRSDEAEEIGDTDSNRNTILDSTQRPLTVAELPTFAAEIWEAYSGGERRDKSDRAGFLEYVGEGGEAVAAALDWEPDDNED